jgi:hypothetical protein
LALPENPQIKKGDVQISQENSHSLKIVATDKSIIHYDQFNIGELEKVEFIQPHSKACILNKVVGHDPSQILGQLSSNGRIFLVNPQGIYFGPNAMINTGSLIASTLNIKDEDFLNDSYRFYLESGSENAKIINDGTLSASEEGCIALFSPTIINKGSILAHAGKIALAASEKVTLDFTGDGLIQFSLEGDLKKALIENYGNISTDGDVLLSLKAAKDAVKMVVNTDGITPANTIIEENGVISLVHESLIKGSNVTIEAPAINTFGPITTKGDLTLSADTVLSIQNSELTSYGKMNLLGKEKIMMRDTANDKTLLRTGGHFFAESPSMDILILSHPQSGLAIGGDLNLISENPISFDAHMFANGNISFLKPSGEIQDFVSLKDPIVGSNQGVTFGNYTGPALKVAAVQTITCSGAITINASDPGAIGDTDSPILTTSPALILRSGVALQGSETLVPVNFSGTNFTNSATAGTTITVRNITTANGPIIINAASGAGSVLLGANSTWQTSGTGAGTGYVQISGTLNGSGARSLNINAGSDAITVTGTTGGITALTSLTAAGSNLSFGSIGGAAAGVTGATTLTATGSLTFTGNNYRANAQTYTGTTFPMTAGSTTTFTSSADTITFGTAGTIQLSSGTNLAINSVNGAITVPNVVASAGTGHTVALNAGTNTAQIGNVGTLSGDFSSTTITGTTLSLKGNIITDAITLTPSVTLNLGGSITTSNNPIAFTTSVRRDTNNTSVLTSNGGNITFASTLNGDVAGRNLTLTAGSGNITFTGAIGGTVAINTLTASGNNITFGTTSYNANTQSYTATSTFPMNAGALTTFTSNGNPISFNTGTIQLSTGTNFTINSTGGNITTANIDAVAGNLRTLTLNAAAGNVQVGAIGTQGANEFTSVLLTGTDIRNTGEIVTNNLTYTATGIIYLGGGITTPNTAITFPRPVRRSNNASITLTSGGAAINFQQTFDGDGILASPNTTLNSGAGIITFTGAVGSINPLNNLTFTNSGALNFNSTLSLTGALTQTNAATGSTTFSNTVSIGSAALNGTTFAMNNSWASTGATSITNSGLITKNSTGIINAAGGFSTTGALNLASNITTTNSSISIGGTLTLAEASTPTLSSGSGSITLLGTVDGTAGGVSENLTLTSTGAVSLSQALGNTVPLGTFSATGNSISVANIGGASAGVTGATNLAATGALTFTGTIYNANAQTYSGTTFPMTAGAATTFTSTADTITFGTTGTIQLSSGTNLAINSAGGAITVPTVVASSGTGHTINLNAGANTAQIGAVGTIAGDFNTVTLTGTDLYLRGNILTNTISLNPTAAIYLGGGITTANTSIVFTQPVIRDFASNVTVSSGGGAITFNSTLNGDGIINPCNLTINSGLSATTISGVIGGVNPLTNLTATGNSLSIANIGTVGSAGVTANTTFTATNALTFTGTNYNANQQDYTAGTDFAMNGGALTTFTSTADSITFNTGRILLSATTDLTINSAGGAITTQAIDAAAGSLRTLIINSGAAQTSVGAIGTFLANEFTSTSFTAGNLRLTDHIITNTISTAGVTGTIYLGGNITTVNTPISFSRPVIRDTNTNSVLNTGATGADITFSNTLDGTAPAGTYNISLASGTGNILFSDNIGATTPIGSLSITSANNVTFTLNKTVTTALGGSVSINNTGALTIPSGATFALDGSFNQNGSGAVSLAANISTTSDLISFSSPLSLSGPVALNTGAGTGNIIFIGTVNGANNLTMSTTNGSISFQNLVGNITPLGTVNITSAGAVDFTNPSLMGAATINNNSTLTISTGANLTLSTGAFQQTGAGNSSLSANITTTNQNISFAGPVTLASATDLNTGAGPGGNITFSSTVQGNNNLTLNTAGNINFVGAVGTSGVHLGALTITSAVNVTANNLYLSRLYQIAGSGTTTFNGLINTSGVLGIDLTGSAFNFNNTVTTTNAGPCTINNSGLLTMAPAATFSLNESFNQTGVGTNHLANSITANGSIAFNSAVVLDGSSSLLTLITNLPITFASSITGTNPGVENLTLNAGTGNIIFSGVVGATRLGDLLIQSANNITASQSITAKSITTTSTGTASFNGALNTNNATGIVLSGNIFNINNTVTTTGSGPLTITNSGSLNLPLAATLSLNGSLTQSGGGSVYLADSITAGNDVQFTNPVFLSGNTSISTAAVNKSISFLSTIDGTTPNLEDLTLALGSGNLSFSGGIGSVVPIGTLTINSCHNCTSGAITAKAINQIAGTGTTNLGGAINTNGAAGIVITTNSVTKGSTINTTNLGPVQITIANAGTLDFSAVGNMTISGPFTQNAVGGPGFGTVLLANELFTTDQPIWFDSPITLTGNADLDSGITGADITINSTVDGPYVFELCSITGDSLVLGAIGSIARIGELEILIAHDATFQAVTADSIFQSGGSGTTTFNGAVDINGASGISLIGTNFTFNAPFTTTSNPFSIVNAGTLTFATAATGTAIGTFSQTGAGGVSLASSITSSGAMLISGVLTVPALASAKLDNSTVNQPISILNSANGSTTGNFELKLGSSINADLTITGNVGSITPFNVFKITSVHNVDTKEITAASIIQSAGSGTSVFQSNLSATGASGIALTGNNFTFEGNLTTSNLSTGPISITNSGAMITTASKAISADGGFTQTNSGGTGTVSLANNITCNTNNITFALASPITLTSNVVLDSSAGPGNITISGTVKGAAAEAQDLTFTAGLGNITLSGILGTATTERLGNVTITSVNNAITNAVYALSIAQQNGSGTSTMNGTYNTTGGAGINLNGTNFNRGGDIIIGDGGSLIVTIPGGGSITGSGLFTTTIGNAYTQNGTGTVDIGGTYTTGGPISFQGSITLAADTVLNSSGGNGNITFANTSTIDGLQSLEIIAGDGNTTFGAAIGGITPINVLKITSTQNLTAEAISAASINGVSISENTIFNGALTTTGAAGISLLGRFFTFKAPFSTGGNPFALTNSNQVIFEAAATGTNISTFTQTQTGVAGVEISSSITTTGAIQFSGPITIPLGATATLDNASVNQIISLTSTIDGPGNLVLNLGNGAGANLTIGANAGSLVPLNNFTITDAYNVTTQAILAASITQTAGAGTSIFNQDLLATGALGISLTGVNFTFSGNLTTAALSTGPIAITNSGAVITTLGHAISADGGFTQTHVAGGTVSLANNVTANSNNITFGSPMTLTTSVVLDSSAGPGNISLSTVDGTVAETQNLTLNAGATGDINFSGSWGFSTRLGNVIFTNANDINMGITDGIYALSVTQVNGSGTFTINVIDTSGLPGLLLNGTNFYRTGNFTLANGGSLDVTIPPAGAITGTGGYTSSIDGFYAQHGTGTVQIGGITATNGPISFEGVLTLKSNTTLNSSAANANITLTNTVDSDTGAQSLTMNAGSGEITLSQKIGNISSLSAFTATASSIHPNDTIDTSGAVAMTGAIELMANITTVNNNITLTGNVTQTVSPITLDTGAGAGDIHITGTLNGDIAGRNLTLTAGTGDVILDSTIGGLFSFNNFTSSGENITLANFGSANPGATGTLTLTANTDINFTGTFYKNGTQVYSAGNNINLTAVTPVQIISNNAPITFNTGITGAIQMGLANLSIVSNGGGGGSGPIDIDKLEGTGRDLFINANNDSVTFTQIGVPVTGLLNSVELVGNNGGVAPPLANIYATTKITHLPNETVILVSPAPFLGDQTYTDPVRIAGLGVVLTCNGNLTFASTLNGDYPTATAYDLTINMNAPNKSVIFTGPIGSIQSLADLTIDAAQDVTCNSTVVVGSFAETNGTGTTSINAGMTANTAGISIDTQDINLAGNFTTVAGDLTLTNSGTLTASNVDCEIHGAINQTTANPVNISGNLHTYDDTIDFTGSVTLNANLICNSVDVAAGNDISFASTITAANAGVQNLILNAGNNGNISFGDSVGATRIGELQIINANNVTTSDAITAKSITQIDGQGTTTFASLNTNNVAGIDLTGVAFQLNGTITTTNVGPCIIDNSGQLTMAAAATCSLSGAFNQIGAGTNHLANSITADGFIQFTSAIVLDGSSSLSTAATFQPITISSTITGTNAGLENLTLAAGTGNLILSGTIGATRVGDFVVSSANDLTASQSITAKSITTTATGITTFSGALNTNNAAGINLTANILNINNTVTTAGSGPFLIANSGALTMPVAATLNLGGALTQTGVGHVHLANSITAAGAVSFASEVILDGATAITATNQLINFSNTIDGTTSYTENLTLNSGSQDITLSNSIGALVPIGALTISNARNVTTDSVTSDSIVQTTGTGTTLLGGAISTTGVAGIDITTRSVTKGSTINTTNLGPLHITIADAGTLDFSPVGDLLISGAFTQNAVSGPGNGTALLSNQLFTINQPISFDSPITLKGYTDLDAGITGNNITINSTVDNDAIGGPYEFEICPITGDATVLGAIGSNYRIEELFILDAHDVSFQNITADSIVQQNGSGTTTFNGAIDVTTSIDLVGNNFTVDNTVLAGSSFMVNNAGTFTLANTGTIDLPGVLGSFSQTGISGSSSLAGSITANDGIEFQGPVTIPNTETATLDTSSSNASIHFLSTVDSALAGVGNLDLTLGTTAGSNAIFDFDTGSITPIGNFIIHSAYDVSANNITAASIDISGSHTTTVDSLITSSIGGVVLSGNNITLSGSVTTSASGPVTITNSGALITTAGQTISSDGAFTQTSSGIASTVSLATPITTNGQNLSLQSPITLTFPITLSTGALTAGDINISGTINGNQALTLTSGLGNITLSASIGNTTRIGIFTINEANDITLSAINASSINQAIAATGTTYITGPLNTNNPLGVRLNGFQFQRSASITTTNGGPLHVTNSGLMYCTTLSSTSIDGSYTQDGIGDVWLAGNISTNNQSITFSSPITLKNPATLNSGAIVGGPITLNGTVDGGYDFTITAGEQLVQLLQPIGTTDPLNSLTIAAGSLDIDDIGNVLPGAAGVAGDTLITSENFINFNGTTYNAHKQTYQFATIGSMTAGALTTFSSSGSDLSFEGIELGVGNIILDTGTDLTLQTSGGNLSFGSILGQPADGRTVILNAGAGSIDFAGIGALGDTQIASLTITSSNASPGISYTNSLVADAITFGSTGTLNAGGDIYTTNTALTFTGPVVLTATNLYITDQGIGNAITFNSTLNGDIDYTRSLTLTTNNHNVTFIGAVGQVHPLKDILIPLSLNVTVSSNLTAASFVESNATGTTTINGAMNLDASPGLSITGNIITINPTASITTTNNAPMTIANSGVLTLGGTANLSGGFTQSGGGSSILSADMTAEGPIYFTDPVTLSGSPSLDTQSASQDIYFANTIEGSGNLTLASGLGDITFANNAGTPALTRLGNLTITNCRNLSVKDIYALTIHSLASSGTATLIGAINTTGPDGAYTAVYLAGNNFLRQGNLQTANGGSVTRTNSGTITRLGASTAVVDGYYLVNGTGPVDIGGTFTTINGGITFDHPTLPSPITLLNDATLVSGNGDIVIGGTINGGKSLTLEAGAYDILIKDDIGSITPINGLTIVSVKDADFQNISTSSIHQTAGSGTTTFHGTLTRQGAIGSTLTGTNFHFMQDVLCINGGYLHIVNSGTLTIDPTVTMSVCGDFTQSGLGNVYVGGALNVNNNPASFAGHVYLTGNYSINTGTGTGNVTFNDKIDGPYGLTVDAGLGDTTFNNLIGETYPLAYLIIDAQNIDLDGGAGSTLAVVNNVNLTALNDIVSSHAFYTGATQTYSAGNAINLNLAAPINFTSNGPINFSSGVMNLVPGESVTINTNNGNLTSPYIFGDGSQGVTIQTGTGNAILGGMGIVNIVNVNAGQIYLAGQIDATSANFTSLGAISNLAGPVAINTSGNSIFNALNGNVGSIADPVWVNALGQVFIGSTYLGAFIGTTSDNTIHPLLSNDPWQIYFNGIKIYDRGSPPIPPTPGPAPIVEVPYAMPGFYSSYFTLADNYFFYNFFINDEYFKRDMPLFITKKGIKKKTRFFKTSL